MNTPETIFDFIKIQETAYNQGVDVVDGWNWSMKNHIRRSILMKNSQLESGKNEGTIDEKPVKNIIRWVRNVQDRAEDIDVKDIIFYTDDDDQRPYSFLLKKYHDDVFVVENDMDTYWDELKEERGDLGGAITMDIGKPKPEILNLQDIAFCNQHNLLSGPIGFKYTYTPSDLQEMKDRHWGDKAYGADVTIDELITLAKNQKRDGKELTDTIEVYLIMGSLTEKYFDNGDENKYSSQVQVVGFYYTEKGRKGVTLFRVKTELPLKVLLRDKIKNRALGWGGIEELFDAQTWTTYSEIRRKELLDATSKILLLTDDSELAARHPSGLKGVGNLEILEVEENKKGLWQADTFPRSIGLFEKAVNEWEEYAQRIGGATDPLLGENAPSGTPFRAQERSVIEGKGLHEYRRGKFAKDVEAIYRDWIIPKMIKEASKGKKFISKLSMDEMQKISENLATRKLNQIKKDTILSGKKFDLDEEAMKAKIKDDFLKGGDEKPIEILKGEMKDLKVKIKINVAGKQKNLSLMVDKLSNVFRQIFANPQGFLQVMQIPAAAKAFNDMLELSNLSPINYGFSSQLPQQQISQPQTQMAANTMK